MDKLKKINGHTSDKTQCPHHSFSLFFSRPSYGAYIVYKQYSKMLDMRLVYMLRVSHHYPTSTRIKPLTAIYTATESLEYLDIG